MSCDQSTMDHNGNKLNEFLFTFCVIHGSDYMTFCVHFMNLCFTCMFKYLCIVCVCNVLYNFYHNKLLLKSAFKASDYVRHTPVWGQLFKASLA